VKIDDVQEQLDLWEQTGKIASWDTESTGLRGDYDSILVISVKPYGKKAVNFVVDQIGNDEKVVKEAGDFLATFPCWITYYGKGFDVKMLNTRRLRHGIQPVRKRHHIDMYYQLKSKILTARRSQGHLLTWLEAPEQKMSVSATAWAEMSVNPKKHLPIMVKRCESDCKGLEDLYKRTRHVIVDITT
jgi:uncharacterized protein YprB with RNaseH-like and TPR domain